MHKAADRIRNVALDGHRGSGKTSLHEALLFSAEAVNRLGSVVDGSTMSDTDPDEKARQMSISAALSAFGQHVVATEIPIGTEHEISGVIDLVDMKAYRYDGDGRDNCNETPIPDELADQAQEYREKLMDEVSESSDELMERYLEGEEISHEEIVAALKQGTNHGALFPVTCGVATHNLATNRLLDAIVEDLPSPVMHGGLEVGEVTLEPVEGQELFAYVFKTRADTFAGRINLFRVYQGVLKQDSQVLNTRVHSKERIGQLLTFEG